MRHLPIALVFACIAVASSEPATVIAKRTEPAAVAKSVDQDITQRLSEANIPPSGMCSDAEFLRRSTLDITGTLPTVERVKEFLADTDKNKRAKLIDELLADHDYGENFASIWFDLLVQPNDDNRALITKSMEKWLADQFNSDRGWDAIVSSILTAEGQRDENPATVFWLAQSDMNAKPAHVKTADVVGKVTQRFLGTQFQCAECHDHPFTQLRQQDFWGTAAFFGSVSLKDAQKKQVRADGIPSVLERVSARQEMGTIKIPDTANDTATTHFPDGTPYDAKKTNGASLRSVFAAWCTSGENEQFSRAMVNRMWAHFLGRGFVMPVDDFRPNNAPSHPDALDALAKSFSASRYDLKHLIRCICLTQAYQRSSEVNTQNKTDEALYSHAPLKMLSATVLENALDESLGNEITQTVNSREKGKARGKAVRQKKKAGKKQQIMGTPFEQAFATSEEPDDPEYSHGVPQVLQLMNGDHLSNSPLLNSVTRATTVKEGVEHLYLATVSRMPTAQEMSRMQSFVDRSANRTAGYQSVLWALLNSSEYVLNH